VAGDLYNYYTERCQHPEEQAWVLCMLGEMHEARQWYASAGSLYSRALNCYPSAKAAFRLCRALFMQGLYEDCVAAYELGVSHAAVPQILDDGPVYADSSKILVAQALHELGRVEEARTMARQYAGVFPHSEAALELCSRICGEEKP
jgi:hypothetical protein